MSIGRILKFLVIGLVLGALLLGDLLLSFAGAQEPGAVPQEPARIHLAQQQDQTQQRRPRTLMDLLFGNRRQQQQQPQVVEQPQRQQRRTTSPSVATLPPPKPTVAKAADAKRIAVMGDSLAVDLGKALERFYAEDPNIAVVPMGVGSSGLVRDDFFDWNKAVSDQIAANSFDLAVIFIGVNDRQEIKAGGQTYPSLTEGWTKAYTDRLNAILGAMRTANKPVIWIGLPPMQASSYSSAMGQISAIHRLASFSGGAEFIDIYDKYADENGKYSSYGPDLSGKNVLMRKEDGIHLSTAGSDKLAYYVNESIRKFYTGGTLAFEVADPLNGTDGQSMMRPPFQGLGQMRQIEVAGAVIPLSQSPDRATDLMTAQTGAGASAGFDLDRLMQAPVGRVDAFGLGVTPQAAQEPRGL